MRNSALRLVLVGLIFSMPKPAAAEWSFHMQESAFNIRGTYSIYITNEENYTFSVWCQPEGLFAIFDTTEVLDVSDVEDRAKIPYVLLFRADDHRPRYYVGDVQSEQRHLRLVTVFDPVAIRQMADSKARVAIAIQTSSGIIHEQSFGVGGLTDSATTLSAYCWLTTS